MPPDPLESVCFARTYYRGSHFSAQQWPLHFLLASYGPAYDLFRGTIGFVELYRRIKKACTSCTTPPQCLKWLCRTFQTPKTACMSVTGTPQWLKHLCPTFPTIKHVCTSITGPPQRFKWLCRTFLMPKHVCTSITEPLQRFSSVGFVKLYRRLKKAFSSFTGPPQCLTLSIKLEVNVIRSLCKNRELWDLQALSV